MIAAMIASLALAACGLGQGHAYPDAARAQFNRTCPAGDPVCDCMWEKITRTVSYEDFEAATARLEEQGLVDPRIVRARTECLERHAG
jgi:hypothetical protein